jgi:hypothetical protein
MANETTTTTLTELVNSSYIERLILDYAIDEVVIAPHCLVSDLAGKASKVADFSVWVKDSAADITEATAMSNTALETTRVQVTAAQVGILREITDLVVATNIHGSGLYDSVVQDGAQLLADALENDLAAEFANASGSVGTSGTDMSVADFVSAMSTLNTAKAKGLKVCVLHPTQVGDLQASIAASSATIFGNESVSQSLLDAGQGAYVGNLFGVDIWYSSHGPSANMGADVTGAMFISSPSRPKNSAYGIAQLWLPKVKQETSAANTSELLGITMCYGVGEISDFNTVQIVTDA